MPENRPGRRPRFRTVVTTALLVIVSIMILRDILVRRWGGSAPRPADAIRPSR